MRVVAVVVLLVALVLVIFNRERIFVRDPIATVYRNGVKQSGVEVYFNFSSDVLLQQSHGDPAISSTILQHWDMMPGTPASLTCLRWIVCLTPADHVPVMQPNTSVKSAYDPKATMNGRLIEFVDRAGVQVRVEL